MYRYRKSISIIIYLNKNPLYIQLEKYINRKIKKWLNDRVGATIIRIRKVYNIPIAYRKIYKLLILLKRTYDNKR